MRMKCWMIRPGGAWALIEEITQTDITREARRRRYEKREAWK